MKRIMTEMVTNQKLTKEWIQYLKNNQIVELQSDPQSGKLNYKKPVTEDDVIDFLTNNDYFSQEEIEKALDSVGGEQSAASNVATRPTQQQQSPGQEPQTQDQPEPAARPTYDNSNATDVEPRYGPRTSLPAPTRALPAPVQPEKKSRTGGKQPGQVSQTPNAIRKRQSRANRRSGINEDFTDNPGAELSEKQVEEVFKILTAGQQAQKQQAGHGQPADQENPRVDPVQVRIEEINKIKRVIRDKMSDQQRMSLWRALTDA